MSTARFASGSAIKRGICAVAIAIAMGTAHAQFLGDHTFGGPDWKYSDDGPTEKITFVFGSLTVALSGLTFDDFSNSVIVSPGTPATDSTDLHFCAMESVGGQAAVPIQGFGSAQFHIDPGPFGTPFPTQIVSLNLDGGAGGLLRIDPTTPSLGQTTMTDLGGGTFQINSFFDVFVDLSIDGGATWTPGTDPTGPGGAHHMTASATPEPFTLALGVAAVTLATRRRIQARDRRSHFTQQVDQPRG